MKHFYRRISNMSPLCVTLLYADQQKIVSDNATRKISVLISLTELVILVDAVMWQHGKKSSTLKHYLRSFFPLTFTLFHSYSLSLRVASTSPHPHHAMSSYTTLYKWQLGASRTHGVWIMPSASNARRCRIWRCSFTFLRSCQSVKDTLCLWGWLYNVYSIHSGGIVGDSQIVARNTSRRGSQWRSANWPRVALRTYSGGQYDDCLWLRTQWYW